MNVKVIQYALKCKEELDKILEAIESIRIMLFDNDLDDVYAATLHKLECLRLRAHQAIESLEKGLEEFIK